MKYFTIFGNESVDETVCCTHFGLGVFWVDKGFKFVLQ